VRRARGLYWYYYTCTARQREELSWVQEGDDRLEQARNCSAHADGVVGPPSMSTRPRGPARHQLASCQRNTWTRLRAGPGAARPSWRRCVDAWRATAQRWPDPTWTVYGRGAPRAACASLPLPSSCLVSREIAMSPLVRAAVALRWLTQGFCISLV
jgi:hypothetical protein